ncbi:MAG: hypothetical protein RBU30_15930 [Polyangia bacterium]|jgi:uncharacterized iron-regulated membrane protein|nr:hypothetical protein [Polyangia bacterium]
MGAEHQTREHHAPGRKLRRLHRIAGLVCAPMLIITSVCGALLLLRKTGLYERKGAFREAIQSLHSYELLLPYVGLIACALMLTVTITGLLLVLRGRR